MYSAPRTIEELETMIDQRFGRDIMIAQMVLGNFEVGHTARAWVFLDDKKHAYLYIAAQARLTLGEVKKLVARVGINPGKYIAPGDDDNYFDDIGRKKYREVFPGMQHVSDTDIIYYRTLAAYNPALIEISEIKNGELKCFDTTTPGDWRVAKRFSYRKIQTDF